jgi:plasmid stabilization system protein ParE
VKPIRFRARAIENINTQTRYLLNHAPHVVTPLKEDIRKTLSLIREFPDAGHSGEVPGTREIISLKFRYIAVYVVHKEWLEVLRFYFRGQRKLL